MKNTLHCFTSNDDKLLNFLTKILPIFFLHIYNFNLFNLELAIW